MIYFRLATPPGTKIRITGNVQVSTGFLELNKRNCEMLGGTVEKLVENWQLKKVKHILLQHYISDRPSLQAYVDENFLFVSLHERLRSLHVPMP